MYAIVPLKLVKDSITMAFDVYFLSNKTEMFSLFKACSRCLCTTKFPCFILQFFIIPLLTYRSDDLATMN